MIYWDNAATTWPKPSTVRFNICKALCLYGANPGRSGHDFSLKTAERIYRCREKVSEFFGVGDPSGVIFTPNCTTALNMVIHGILAAGGRAVISDLEHNAVVRPLTALSPRHLHYDIVPWCEDEDELVRRFRHAITKETRLIVCAHASNVFGVTLPIRKIGALAHEFGLPFCVDAAQTAGILPLDMKQDNVDYLCVAPHKGLYAPMGTGLLLCRERDRLGPWVYGGTGSYSLQTEQPTELPDRLESGTPNVAGICGLLAGLEFVKRVGKQTIYMHEIQCLQQVYDALYGIPQICFYGDRPSVGKQAPVLSLNVGSNPSEEVAFILNSYGIAVRAGLHCAPYAHRHFGTVEQGTVRLAPSVFSTTEEVKKICKVFSQIAEKTLH